MVHRELGTSLWLARDLAAAETALRKAISLDPADSWSYDALYSVLRASKRYPEAQQSIRTAIRLRPDVPLFHSELGDVLALQGLLREAEQAYLAALGLDVADFSANWYYARFLEERGYLERAEKYSKRALAANPASQPVKHALVALRERRAGKG